MNEKLARGALVLCILSVFTCFFSFLCIPLGALAILLALLSRGKGRLAGTAVTAIIVSVFSITASAAATGYAVWKISSSPQLRQRFDAVMEYYEGLYGLSDGGASSGSGWREEYLNELLRPRGTQEGGAGTAPPILSAAPPEAGKPAAPAYTIPAEGGAYT